MARAVGIIQARVRSERLPGKILSPLAGRPLLALLATRIARARVDEWWLATSSDPADDVTEAWAFELGLRVYRGHATDVLSRFLAVDTDEDLAMVRLLDGVPEIAALNEHIVQKKLEEG